MDRSCIHLLGMSAQPGQSLEQLLDKSHFQPWGNRPIIGVTRRIRWTMQPIRRAVPQIIPRDRGTHIHSPWLENSSSTYFVQSCDVCYGVCLTVRATPYCSKSQLSWTLYRIWQMLCTQRNFLVMREISVVISWMDPTMVVDSFFGMPQLGCAAPAPTMLLREAPPQYPNEALLAEYDTHNSKLCCPDVALLMVRSWTKQLGRKRKRNFKHI